MAFLRKCFAQIGAHNSKRLKFLSRIMPIADCSERVLNRIMGFGCCGSAAYPPPPAIRLRGLPICAANTAGLPRYVLAGAASIRAAGARLCSQRLCDPLCEHTPRFLRPNANRRTPDGSPPPKKNAVRSPASVMRRMMPIDELPRSTNR